MNDRLNRGDLVIQGRHIISNPEVGLFPALTWSMMTVDNRFSNQGRNNLGLSAKHMGDSICFRSEVLKRLGWGTGLTEDYEFRLRLLLEGIRIRYEPAALGYGQAPQTWKEAQAQRLRWARGMADSGKRFRKQLLLEGLNQRSWSKIDGSLTTLLPSFSTLALISMIMLFLHLLLPFQIPAGLVYSWAGLNILWLIYPIIGLALEKGPWWSYAAIFSGPIFMLWRTWLNIQVRITPNKVAWIRTPHRS
jgi:cellulose synthase/poly-beta-1,6-N-acetylglucosamine synthase-like glycosyltransferase